MKETASLFWLLAGVDDPVKGVQPAQEGACPWPSPGQKGPTRTGGEGKSSALHHHPAGRVSPPPPSGAPSFVREANQKKFLTGALASGRVCQSPA